MAPDLAPPIRGPAGLQSDTWGPSSALGPSERQLEPSPPTVVSAPRPPSLGTGVWGSVGLWAAPRTPARPPPCSEPPALQSLLFLCHI